MITSEFATVLDLNPSDLKLWLRRQRKGVKFYPELRVCQFDSGPQKIEVLRTSQGLLSVNPVGLTGFFSVGQPFGYAVGHATGKLISSWVFPSSATVKALVVALETCGVDWIDPESLPTEEVTQVQRLIHRTYREKLRPWVHT